MSSSPGQPLANRRRRIAITLSVTIHGIALWLIAEVPWVEPRSEEPLLATLIFVVPPEPPEEPLDRLSPEPATNLPDMPEAPDEPTVEANIASPATRRAASDEAATPAADTNVEPAAEPDEAADEPAPSASDEAVAEVTDRPAELPRIDFSAAGRAAVDAVLDREAGKRTFGGDDLVGDGSPGEGSTVPSPFESNLPPAAALRPNRSRSALVRRIGRICEGLTGGISLFGIVALCTDAYGRRDIFADIRPDYLDELPECEEVELSAAAQAMAIDAGLSTTPIKCRMVHRDERYRD